MADGKENEKFDLGVKGLKNNLVLSTQLIM